MAQMHFEHIELPAKLLDYFLRSNQSNINQCHNPITYTKEFVSTLIEISQNNVTDLACFRADAQHEYHMSLTTL